MLPLAEHFRQRISGATLAGAVLAIILTGHGETIQAARLPSAGRECAICHIMWLTEFKRADVETLIPYDPTPVTPSGKEDVVSTERMCFSCHDGFVLDSRFMWRKGTHMHPVGKKPSDKIHIPLVEGKEVYPLNEDGKVYCGTCHTAHGVDWDQKENAVFMRVLNKDGQLCTACHDDKSVGPKKGGHPLFEKLKKIPAVLSELGAAFGKDAAVLCQSCHRPHGAAGEKILLLENDRSQLCGACHTERDAPDRETAGRLGTHPVHVQIDPSRIPDALVKQGAKFGKPSEVICQTCHRPHDATPGTSLLVAPNDESSLCMSCHRDQKRVADGKHDMRLVEAGDKNIRDEKVGEAGVCSACHVPHEGKGPKMWARPLVNDGTDPMAALCLSCHRNKGLAHKSQVGAHSHPVGVGVERLGVTVDLPTYSLEGVKKVGAKTGLVTCASCHDPHGPPVPAGGGEAPGTPAKKFLRKVADRESSLCRTCHKRQAKISGTKHDLRITAPDERNVRDQSLDQSGVCGACHLVHNAAGPFLWARKPSPKADLASATCMSCHDENGPAKDKGVGADSHPVGVDVKGLAIRASAGDWRATNNEAALLPLPLYDKGGRHTLAGGRVGCASCHDPHVWSADGRVLPAQDAKKTEGGPDDSFLRIADQGKSALCLNCHIDKGTVTRSKHNLKLAGGGKVKPGQKAEPGASVCAVCHTPHKAKGPALWARDTGPGDGAIEVLCKDCHRVGGNAEDKLTGDHSHPVGIALPAGMKAGNLPVYTKEGRRRKPGGRVDCATCHNPHRWIPEGLKDGSGQKPEDDGDGRNSFLRLPAAPDSQLCVQCHQEQRWVRGTDHDLRTAAPSAVNRNGLKPGESGVCGQCHVPHNGFSSETLWARMPGETPTGNVADARCRSCHEEGRVAGNKAPVAAKHPSDVVAWSAAIQSTLLGRTVPDIRVYDTTGKPAASGRIACPSCHDPHRWDPERAEEGRGAKIEGDVRTSFLRTSKSESFTCAACHGLDSIFRYKYFHSEATHQKHPLSR